MALSHSDHSTLVHRLRAAGCVYAEDEADLLIAATDSAAALADLVDRRVAGQPLEHLLGWAEFCGLRVAVDPGVFVPRGRTALLVATAAAVAGPAPAVLDLCCGSGAAALVLHGRLAPRWLAAADLDPTAVACARRNLAPLGVPVYEGDLFAAVPAQWRGRLDLVVANAPYVPSGAVALMPAEARLYEALMALDGGVDGLAVLRGVAAGAAEWLAPGGHLVVEVSAGQAEALCAVLTGLGLAPTVVHDDDLDATAVTARRPAFAP
jgi:release factor glutamine methyltransferase